MVIGYWLLNIIKPRLKPGLFVIFDGSMVFSREVWLQVVFVCTKAPQPWWDNGADGYLLLTVYSIYKHLFDCRFLRKNIGYHRSGLRVVAGYFLTPKAG
jgi:hypothetical protein